MIRVSITNAHGTFTTTTSGLDLMISRHLPASPAQLRRVMSAASGIPEESYADVRDVSEFLVMLAGAEGYAYEGGNVIPSPPG